jgi:hypothetical protein
MVLLLKFVRLQMLAQSDRRLLYYDYTRTNMMRSVII